MVSNSSGSKASTMGKLSNKIAAIPDSVITPTSPRNLTQIASRALQNMEPRKKPKTAPPSRFTQPSIINDTAHFRNRASTAAMASTPISMMAKATILAILACDIKVSCSAKGTCFTRPWA